MEVASKTCPELETEYRENGPELIEYLDGLTDEVDDLSDRLQQIKSISIMAQRSLEQTLSCPCCAEDILGGTFRAIESIANNQHAQ